MRRSVKLAGSVIGTLLVAAVGVRYFSITGGEIKTCGAEELWYCGFFSSDDCRLKVKVVDDCAKGSSAISVENDDLHMCNSRKIIWRLRTDGYKFADDGIAFKDPNADFDGRQRNDYTFVWRNKHSRPSANDNEWTYKIHVLKENGSECAVLDPRIYNE